MGKYEPSDTSEIQVLEEDLLFSLPFTPENLAMMCARYEQGTVKAVPFFHYWLCDE